MKIVSCFWKQRKFEEYYFSVSDKFVASLQIYLATILGRYQDTSEVGDGLRSINQMKNIRLKFILVIKNVEDTAWLVGPLAELKSRLLPIRKVWGIEVAVLNEELAKQYHLIC